MFFFLRRHFGILMCELLFYGKEFVEWEEKLTPLPDWTLFSYRELIYYCFSSSLYISFPLIEFFVKNLEKQEGGAIRTQVPSNLSHDIVVENYLKRIIPLLFEKFSIPLK